MKAFQILLAALAIFALVWFVVFEKSRSAAPSKSEKAVAYGWLIFRRVVCFSVAGFFGVATVAVLVFPTQGSSFSSLVGAFLFSAFIAFIAAWVGMYGGGRRRAMWEDRAVHQERKKRYGWPW
jgi:hypothetical protein